MNPALLLIDFQKDYLASPELQPAAGAVVERASTLLHACREQSVPVFHMWTTVHRSPDDRMPHWKATDKWWCEEGTAGHATPEPLRPEAGERIIHKQFFSGFENSELDAALKAMKCNLLLIAGIHTHACVRATALDAYQRGYAVGIVDDAVASDDALHAAITRRYLTKRAVTFGPVQHWLAAITTTKTQKSPQTIEHRSPADHTHLLWTIENATRKDIAKAVSTAKSAGEKWNPLPMTERAVCLHRLAEALSHDAAGLAHTISEDIGKPIAMALAEVQRSVAILEAVAEENNTPLTFESSPDAHYRYQPLGAVAVVTPWNNPLAIPVGKIAPAIFFGNTVLWKPAPTGARIARHFLKSIVAAGLESVVQLIPGDHHVAMMLAEESAIDAVTISGSLAAGQSLQEICARRCIPFQGELGGNNAAIVWQDTDLRSAAEQIAAGAFGFAGQRCTANRRAIVSADHCDTFVTYLIQATAKLPWGDPMRHDTVIGPLIRKTKCDEVLSLIERAKTSGLQIIIPHHDQKNRDELMQRGAYCPPAIVLCDEPSHEIVQEETFGPVLIVQRALNFDHAMALCNGVRQGLVAALFSESQSLQQEFLQKAQAGVLKLNRSTVDADARSPLGGWKSSGVGPAEHGPSDREFFTRVQTIYGG